MIKELSKPKPKKGAEFIITESTESVWLFHITDSNTYTVSKTKDFKKVFNINISKLRPAPKVRKPIGNKPKPLTKEEKQFKADLNVFYAEALNELPDNCQECNAPLGCLSAWDARCCTAHILEKNIEHGFPTIACHPANKLFLGKKNCCCHDRYDKKGAEFRSKMKVYPVVLAAFEILKEDLSDHDIIRAKKYLNIKS